jgi:hypothetical protein
VNDSVKQSNDFKTKLRCYVIRNLIVSDGGHSMLNINSVKKSKEYIFFFVVVPCIVILSKSFLFLPTEALYICLVVH